jgi:hypothetical protein
MNTGGSHVIVTLSEPDEEWTFMGGDGGTMGGSRRIPAEAAGAKRRMNIPSARTRTTDATIGNNTTQQI